MAQSSFTKAERFVFKRPSGLAQLVGVADSDAEDYSLEGRLSIIAKLKAARKIEIARGRAKSWLYDINRHLNLCAALRAEYEALEEYISENSKAGGAVKATAEFTKPELAPGTRP